MAGTILEPDICVIGAGSAGLTVAAASAAFGVPVVLVEKHRMGGDCLNYGCVPSKALIAAARHAQARRGGAAFGIEPHEPAVDFARVHAHVHDVIAAIAPTDSVERFEGLGVTVLKAEARFRDARTIEAGDTLIRARRFVLATGSRPAVPALPGLDGVAYLTNETIFDLTTRPDHLIVLGGGPIGLELAQAHRRLGARVTVVTRGRALAREDADLAAVVLEAVRAEGVTLVENARTLRVDRKDGAIALEVETEAGVQRIEGSHLLVATGRRPAVEALGLDKAGIAHDEKGIRVDAGLRTTNRRVYAIGDASGGPQFTHVAGYQGGLAVRSLLFRLPVRQNPMILPRATFTAPEIAHVGLSAADAASRPGARVLTWDYRENDRAQAERQTAGRIKLVADRRGRLLGASIVGANAAEMINFWSLALSKSMTLRDIAGYVSPYPTYTEIGKRAAVSSFAGLAARPAVRWIVRALRLFG